MQPQISKEQQKQQQEFNNIVESQLSKGINPPNTKNPLVARANLVS